MVSCTDTTKAAVGHAMAKAAKVSDLGSRDMKFRAPPGDQLQPVYTSIVSIHTAIDVFGLMLFTCLAAATQASSSQRKTGAPVKGSGGGGDGGE